MIIYLTYNDQPSGVYWSQVTDVVDHLNTLGGPRVRLVALVSLRGFGASRKAIRARCPDALVLPMVPRAHNWKVNWIWLWLLCRSLKPTGIVGRGIFATALALRMRKAGLVEQVCFDARAAYGAEWEEFRVVDDDRLIAEATTLEAEVIHQSDLRMSVSEALVDHWRERYHYHGHRHTVVPCTLGRSAERHGSNGRAGLREALGWAKDDVVLVYSGTAVGWQSLDLMYRVLLPWLQRDARHRMLFLSEAHPRIEELMARFPAQVVRRWVDHAEVRSHLLEADHGLLLREPCITNRVASPTKFAEYLSAGLPVVISEGVGDFSQRVERDRLGTVLAEGAALPTSPTSVAARERLMRHAADHFSKEAYSVSYKALLDQLQHGGAAWKHDAHAVELPRVSIVVPSFNKRGFIGATVASVQAQTDPRWELLVVDDASTDGSVELLRSMAAADPRIRVIAYDHNVGANACRNEGIRLASAPYVIFLDADDLLDPSCVERRLAVMDGSDLDMAVFTMEVFREKPGDHGQRWDPATDMPLEDFFRHKLPWQTMQPIWYRPFLQALGGFDEAFTRHQDVELHTRALLADGVRYRLFPGAPDCWYRIAEERKVIDPRRLLERFSRSAVMYHDKFLPAAHERGNGALLLGIIHRTYLQVLLNAKDGRIAADTLKELEDVLYTPFNGGAHPPVKRAWMRLTRWYNLLPVRVPGVNRLLFELLTRA